MFTSAKSHFRSTISHLRTKEQVSRIRLPQCGLAVRPRTVTCFGGFEEVGGWLVYIYIYMHACVHVIKYMKLSYILLLYYTYMYILYINMYVCMYVSSALTAAIE